ncbi:MAG: IS1595 family transposase [Desulfovibrio sp.]|jgi:transposase|nr:IS1595 family transposase [Desulfovibrio sp.]
MQHEDAQAAPAALPETEDAARELLLGLTWPDGAKHCPRCRAKAPYQLAGGRLRCGGCRYTFHDFTGRWLNETGLSPLKWVGLAKAFAQELSTREAAAQVGISYNTAFKALTVLRLAIVAQGADAPQLLGPGAPLYPLLDAAHSEDKDFAPGTALPVYGLLSRSRHIFVDLLPELTAESVLHFNHNFHLRVARHGSILITDRYKTYDALILCGDENLPYHYLLRHPGQIFAESGGCPFWDFARPRLRQFKGLSWRRFPLYLKELALRHNLGGQALAPALLAALCTPVPKLAQ